MAFEIPPISNEEKEAVWQAYRDRRPTRVPVVLGTNSRVIVLNEKLNTRRRTFAQVFSDPAVMLEVMLDHLYYCHTVLHQYCDWPVGLPKEWTLSPFWLNVYEAAFFGAPVQFRPGQIPDTEPFLGDQNKNAIFDVDLDGVLERGIFRKGLDFAEKMKELAARQDFHGRPVKISRFVNAGTDGPLTVAINLRGPAFLEDLVLDEEYAGKLMAFLVEAVIRRMHAFRKFYGDETIWPGYFADDAIQLISAEMYRRQVLPHHRRFFQATWPADVERNIHLCGNVLRHMKTVRQELNVTSFDTGFPVDFARMRQELGEDVEIYGGPPISLLLSGKPQEVYDTTCRILASGIKAGGRFVLREGNNLPPCVPEANLAAMYKACLDEGKY
jgi:uroporphyrinogen-III decarboxylase